MNRDSSCISDIRQQDGVAVVVLAGELNMHHVPAVHAALADLCRSQPARLVINLEKITYMDSSGLGVLVAALRWVRDYGGAMALCALPQRVRGVFEVARLDTIFSIYPTEAEALAK